MPFLDIGGDMVARVQGASLAHIFQPLIDHYGMDMERFNKSLFYILMVYSRDSEYLHAGCSYDENKINIVKELNIPEDLSFNLIDLVDQPVYLTVDNYIQYQGSRTWEHLVMVRELYEQMRNSARSMMKKNDLIDWDQKMKNAKYAKELYEETIYWEKTLASEEQAIFLDKGVIHKKKGETKKAEVPTLRYEDTLRKVRDEMYRMQAAPEEKPDDEPKEE